MNTTYSSPAVGRLGALGGGLIACYFLFVVLFIALMVAIYWKMFSKAGYSGWLSLLMFVPIVNFGMMLFLAFSDWPVLQELRQLRGSGGGRIGYPPPINPQQTTVPGINSPQAYAAPAPPARGDAGSGYAPPVPTAPASAYAPTGDYIPETLPAAPPPTAPVWEPVAQPQPQYAPQPAPQPVMQPMPASMPQPAPAPQPAAAQPAAPAWEPVAPPAPPAPAPMPQPAPQPAPSAEPQPPAPPAPPAQ